MAAYTASNIDKRSKQKKKHTWKRGNANKLWRERRNKFIKKCLWSQWCNIRCTKQPLPQKKVKTLRWPHIEEEKNSNWTKCKVHFKLVKRKRYLTELRKWNELGGNLWQSFSVTGFRFVNNKENTALKLESRVRILVVYNHFCMDILGKGINLFPPQDIG